MVSEGRGQYMNNVNKTLYIPLYGKSYVSKKGIILDDKKAEEIWEKEGFSLKGKSKSKYLAYYMGMRSKVFDNWIKEQIQNTEDAIILHIGCGMDSRVLRVGKENCKWYDIDFPDVIKERKRYYNESENYQMIASDARQTEWLKNLSKEKKAIVILEGISMYLQIEELKGLLKALKSYFTDVVILMDCYTTFAAKASKYKNPINDVGVTVVYGLDEPKILEDGTGISFFKEHEMTPVEMINELQGMEKAIFKKVYAGKISKKMYRLYEFTSA